MMICQHVGNKYAHVHCPPHQNGNKPMPIIYDGIALAPEVETPVTRRPSKLERLLAFLGITIINL
jgi:hypothetical protein